MACKAVRQCPMHIEYEPGMNQDKAKDSIVKKRLIIRRKYFYTLQSH